jgi:putative transposase
VDQGLQGALLLGGLSVLGEGHIWRKTRYLGQFDALPGLAAPAENLDVQRFQSYKFRLTATADQKLQMRQITGCCRFVFNRALALQNQRRDEGRKLMSSDQLALLLVEWRKHPDSLWLADAPFGTQRQALKDLDRAFSRQASQLAQSPRFKKRGRSDSLRFADPREIKLDQANSRILLPKLGWVRYRNSRAVVGATRSVTVSASGANGRCLPSQY